MPKTRWMYFAALAAMAGPGTVSAQVPAGFHQAQCNQPLVQQPVYCPQTSPCPPANCPPQTGQDWHPTDPGTVPHATDPNATDPNTTPNTTDPNATSPQDPNANAPQLNTQPQMNPSDVFNNAPAAGNSLASSLGTGAADGPGVPNMIGDFFGTSGNNSQFSSLTFITDPSLIQSLLLNPSFLQSFLNSSSGSSKLNIVLPNPGGSVVGRQKIAENTSPIPRDRLFFNYSFFDDAPLTQNGVNVNRLTFGAEKTFNNKQGSIEIRVPYAYTLDSDISATSPNTDNAEFGNINLALKHILCQGNGCMFTGGVAVTLPTADDLRFYTSPTAAAPFRVPGRPIEFLKVENQAIHVLPFIGGLWRDECSGWFVQGFAQLDIDTNGNSVHFRNIGQLENVGDLDDATFFFGDIGIGYYAKRDPYANFLTAIAPTLELHYNRSLESGDTIRTRNGSTITGGGDKFELLNLVAGVTLELQHNTTFTAGYGVPILGQDDRQFDGELRISINRFFGGSASRIGYYNR